MKKIFCIVLAAIMIFSLISCSKTGSAKIDYGESELYTMEERETIVNMIIEEIEEGESIVKLKSLEFAGDSNCSYYLEQFKKDYDIEYEKCIVFIANMKTPDAIKYFNEPERTFCYFYVKEPGGEWYLKDTGW